MKESRKLAIFELAAFVFALVAIFGCAATAYIEGTETHLSMFQLIFGNDRSDASAPLIFGFVLLILSALTSLTLATFCLLDKFNRDAVVVGLGIFGGLSALVGGVLLALAVILSGLSSQNSELGFIQGNWTLGPADFIVPISALLALIASYPAGMLIAHHADLKDRKARTDEGKVGKTGNPS